MTGRKRAFTLIELMIVLALLGVMMFITLPALQSMLQSQLQREVARLTALIRVMRNEAILTRTTYRLVIDVPANGYTVEQRAQTGAFAQRRDNVMLQPHKFPPDFKLQDVVLFGDIEHPLSEQPVAVVLDPSGFMDPFMLHFLVDKTPYTLRVSGFTADLRLVDGYVRQ